MFKKWFFPFIMFLFWSTSVCADPDTISTDIPVVSAFTKAFGEEVGDTISNSGGGRVDYFLLAAEEVLKNDRHIKIDGSCKSSCAIFADKARPNICITDNAMFGFHMSIEYHTNVLVTEVNGVLAYQEVPIVLREPMQLSDDIYAWVIDNGGFPEILKELPYEGLLKMDAKQASAFWPMCK